MKNIKAILALKNLNWDLITETACKNGIPVTKENLMSKLADSIHFLQSNNLTEIVSEHWLIKWKPGKENAKNNLCGNLEVFFIYQYAKASYKANQKTDIVTEDIAQKEFKVLHAMLTKAIAVENYELCAVIKSRMMNLIEKKND